MVYLEKWNFTFVIHATYSKCLGPPLLPLARLILYVRHYSLHTIKIQFAEILHLDCSRNSPFCERTLNERRS